MAIEIKTSEMKTRERFPPSQRFTASEVFPPDFDISSAARIFAVEESIIRQFIANGEVEIVYRIDDASERIAIPLEAMAHLGRLCKQVR